MNKINKQMNEIDACQLGIRKQELWNNYVMRAN